MESPVNYLKNECPHNCKKFNQTSTLYLFNEILMLVEDYNKFAIFYSLSYGGHII